MATQTIKGATIAEIEQALVDQYGRTYLRQSLKSDSRGEWTFRYTPRTSAKCVATKTADGVSVSLSAHTPMYAWVLTVIAYALFCVPGIIMTVWLLFRQGATNTAINHRFPKFIEAVQRAMLPH